MSSSYTDQPAPEYPKPDREDPERAEMPKLGSLTQAARGKQLNVARNILLAIGILTLPDQMHKSIQQEVANSGGQVDPAAVMKAEQELLLTNYALQGGFLALGVLFIIFGLLVKRFPVPITIAALVCYVGAHLVALALNPAAAGAEMIVKIAIVLALVGAIQSAFAYERGKREQEALDVAYRISASP
jgi:hypothetical protein